MKTLLFNPFEKYSETKLLMVGFVLTILGSLLAYAMHARFDGVLDLHFVPVIEWWAPLLDNLINIISLSVFLFAAAKIINNRTRFVDILATTVVARLPYYLLPLFNFNHYISNLSANLVDPETMQINDLSARTLFPLVVFSFFAFLVLAWYLVMMYRGYKVASNAKGIKAIMLYILAVILAEVLSKILISQFL